VVQLIETGATVISYENITSRFIVVAVKTAEKLVASSGSELVHEQ